MQNGAPLANSLFTRTVVCHLGKVNKGEKYKLIKYNGILQAPVETIPKENFWLLIGQEGTLMNFSYELNFWNEDRVLIRFDNSVLSFGLECHNPAPNSLWILKTDLEKI